MGRWHTNKNTIQRFVIVNDPFLLILCLFAAVDSHLQSCFDCFIQGTDSNSAASTIQLGKNSFNRCTGRLIQDHRPHDLPEGLKWTLFNLVNPVPPNPDPSPSFSWILVLPVIKSWIPTTTWGLILMICGSTVVAIIKWISWTVGIAKDSVLRFS